MAKLKKFWSNRRLFSYLWFYPYEVTLPLSELPPKMIGKKFIIFDDLVKFQTNKKGLKLLSYNPGFKQYVINNQRNNQIRVLLAKRWLTIISLSLILLIFLTSNHFIREITFVSEAAYSEEVYNFVLENVKKQGPFYQLTKSVTKISEEMRYRFPYYAWIGLIKNGGKLLIDIDLEQKLDIINEDDTPGSLVAKKDGYILSYNVERGIVLINQYQTVKKGQMLVDGNINYYHEDKLPLYLKAKGQIIARTVTLEKVEILKETKETVFTGRYTKQLAINKLFIKKAPYEKYFPKEEVLFKLTEFFQLKSISYYEMQEIIIAYDKISASKYALSLIEKNFYLSKRSHKEKILSQDIIEISEDEEKYLVKIMVISCENIASFVKINQE